jgi:hypothetical protein
VRFAREVCEAFATSAVAALLAIVLAPLPAAAAAFDVPSPDEIFQRVFATNVGMSGVVSADAELKLRVAKPLSAPPDCLVHATVRYDKGRQIMTIRDRTSGTLCWAVQQYAPSQLFDMRKALEDVLPLFDFTVLGVRLVGDDRSYLIEGKARDPNRTNPLGLNVWVDYDRGLLTEGTLIYRWGTVDFEQEYAPLNGGWVLAHQYIYTSRFEASVEVTYSNFRV